MSPVAVCLRWTAVAAVGLALSLSGFAQSPSTTTPQKSTTKSKAAPAKDAKETSKPAEDSSPYAVYEVGPDGETTRVVKGPDVFNAPAVTSEAPKESPESTKTSSGTPLAEPDVAVEPEAPAAPQKRQFRNDRRMAEDAWAVAVGYSSNLPDFTVEELVWRYQGVGRNPDWKVVDWVTVEVRSVDGKESYSNIRMKGKQTDEKKVIEKGSWSTGEYSSTLLDLFSPGTAADFHFTGTSTIASMGVRKYDFRVEKRNSHWLIDVEGNKIEPAYRGTVFVDPRNMRAMRIEMQALDLPADYPLDSVEGNIEYGMARIGSQEYLMPMKSENLTCQRNSPYCSLNKIEFRNYRKFSAQSNVSTVDSDVDFGDTPTPVPPEPKKP